VQCNFQTLSVLSKEVMASLQSRVLAMVENFKSKTLKLTEDGVTYAKTVKSKAVEMSTDTKQWVMTMAQKRMLAAAASKEAMMGYLQNAQVLAIDAYKEFRTTGIKDFTQKYVGLLSHHSQTAVLSLKQLAIKQAQQARASTLALVGSVQDAAKARVVAVQTRVVQTYAKCHSKALDVVTTAKAKGVEISDKAKQAAKDGHVQATCAGVAGGAAALGATGGATGLAAGSAVGAALGLVPAIFTFGLSIPVGAAIGGGTGLAVGTTVGMTAGAVSGGAAGYGAYARKDDIQEMRTRAISRVSSGSRLCGLCEDSSLLGSCQIRQAVSSWWFFSVISSS